MNWYERTIAAFGSGSYAGQASGRESSPCACIRWRWNALKNGFLLLGLIGVAIGCSSQKNNYVLPMGYHGPAVVVWGDPKGIMLGSERRLEIPTSGILFVRATGPAEFGAVFYTRTGSKDMRLPHQTSNPLEYQVFYFTSTDGSDECRSVDFAVDQFLVGRPSDFSELESQLQKLTRIALVETMRHRGHSAGAKCYEERPLHTFKPFPVPR